MLYEQEISLVRLSDGDSGRSSFVHIKYSNDGKTFTANNGEDIGSWLGIYTDDKEEESTVFSDYKWSKILGATGAVGTGIDSVTKEFYLSDSKTTQSGSSWQTKMPEWSYGKYLWTREKIVFKNPTSTVYTTPSCDSSWEAANVVDKKVTTLQTDFKVEQGKIESLIKETSVIKETYTTKDEFNSLQIGGRNLIKYGKGDSKNGIFKNFTRIGDGYAEVTVKSKKTYTSVDVSAGFVLGCRDYKVGSIYIWSYDIMYTEWNFPSGTNRDEFWFGQRYTYTPLYQTGVGSWRGVTKHDLPVVGVNGCKLNEWYHVKKTVLIPEPAASNIGTAASIQFYNSNANVEASFTARFKNVKLELGNKATDWTPAPEDLEQKVTTLTDKYNQTVQTVEGNKTTIANVKTSVDEVSGKVTKMESSITEIKQTADGITTTVTANKDKWDKASSDASNALNNSTQAKKDAENALNKAQDVVNKVESGELDGQDAIMLYIDSSNGTTFKNSSVATIFTVTIYVGGTTIDNSTKLRQMYGDGAYLQWLIKKHGEKDFTKIPLDDPRLNDNGFIFTIAAKDIKFKAVFNCELNI